MYQLLRSSHLTKVLWISIALACTPVLSQEDGGFLCISYHGDEVPIWILRFKIIDRDTHYPVKYANVELISDSRDDGFRWHANHDGVAVFMAVDPNCIPYEGIIEITSPDYLYSTLPISRDFFRSEEDHRRIYLEGHRHNWTSTHDIPGPQEICDKISAKRYQVGVRTILTDFGVNMVNFAPACFEYEIELERVRRDFDRHRRESEYRSPESRWSDRNQETLSEDYTITEDCYAAYQFTAGLRMNSEDVLEICRGKGRSGYHFSHYEYIVRDMGSYTAYDYECIYCK